MYFTKIKLLFHTTKITVDTAVVIVYK